MTEAMERHLLMDTLNRYSHAYDDGDLDEMASLFLDDASFRFEPPPAGFPPSIEGREQIHQAMLARRAATRGHQRRHIVTNVCVDRVDDAEADVRSYLTLASTSEGRLAIMAVGVYRDRLRRTPAGWRFASRHLRLDGAI